MKDAAGPGIGGPESPGLSGYRIADPDRPALPAAPRHELRAAVGRHTDEGDLRSIGREHRRAVVVQARTHPGDALRGEVADPNERVAWTRAHEGEPLAIGREGHRYDLAAIDDEWLRL